MRTSKIKRAAFFEERFKSIAILDEESLLATCAYIDLNPVAAGIVEAPEKSPHTSITERVKSVKAQGRIRDLRAAQRGSVAGSTAAAGLEEPLWLCPIEDRRAIDSGREGMLEGLSLGSYLLLVDYTGRLFRAGKAVITAELANIFDRLGTSADSWWSRLEKLSQGRLLGRYFAAKRERLREVARDLGVHHLANLGGCPCDNRLAGWFHASPTHWHYPPVKVASFPPAHRAQRPAHLITESIILAEHPRCSPARLD